MSAPIASFPKVAAQRGFTLIEVLVALAIVAIGMAALMSALTTSADATTYLRDKTFAEWVALNRIEEVRLALQRPQKGEQEGTVELAGRKWRWEQEVLETEVEGILRIDVRVKPDDVKGDGNWYTTISGITGTALALPSGVIDYFARPPATGNPGGGRPLDPNQPNAPRTGNPDGSNDGNDAPPATDDNPGRPPPGQIPMNPTN